MFLFSFEAFLSVLTVGKGVFWVFGLEMGFLVKFAHRGAQAARILKPLKNGRAHFKAGFWTCGGVGAHF
ncbi:MAG TPA: hypothetical protein PLX18_09475 [Anaerohalosphaeraceae bacterium]|nr:hypothetical protein [Anaerohalosphaeraceae bacterium]HQJ68802.1 hypothetical protein [Anaerohalosphaeraceae bacterium]